jgi:hypothetical protein
MPGWPIIECVAEFNDQKMYLIDLLTYSRLDCWPGVDWPAQKQSVDLLTCSWLTYWPAVIWPAEVQLVDLLTAVEWSADLQLIDLLTSSRLTTDLQSFDLLTCRRLTCCIPIVERAVWHGDTVLPECSIGLAQSPTVHLGRSTRVLPHPVSYKGLICQVLLSLRSLN